VAHASRLDGTSRGHAPCRAPHLVNWEDASWKPAGGYSAGSTRFAARLSHRLPKQPGFMIDDCCRAELQRFARLPDRSAPRASGHSCGIGSRFRRRDPVSRRHAGGGHTITPSRANAPARHSLGHQPRRVASSRRQARQSKFLRSPAGGKAWRDPTPAGLEPQRRVLRARRPDAFGRAVVAVPGVARDAGFMFTGR
jgi:hypothetical protein